MKNVLTSLILLLFISCLSKEDKLKDIIDNSDFGVYGLKKMEEIKKLDEKIFSLPVHYSIVKKYDEITEGNEYEIVRYIYKTYDGAYRIFFIVDYTNKRIIEKSSNANDFFIPIANEILGDQTGSDLEGNNLMDVMRY